MTDAELDAAIADLEGMLNASVAETTHGDTRTKFDLGAAERRLAELKRKRRLRQGKLARHQYATPTFGGACD